MKDEYDIIWYVVYGNKIGSIDSRRILQASLESTHVEVA
jgi:hypothetical protein